MQPEPALLLCAKTSDCSMEAVTCGTCCSVCMCVRVVCAGAFLLASLVSLPESPRWLVIRGQLDEALATLHTIVASSSSSSKGRRRGRSWRARQAAMQQVRAAADAAAGLQPEPADAAAAAAAEDAAWLNAAPEAGRPRNAEQQALEAAEDELLLLWSSVQKEQAAGLELRQAATGAAGPRSAAGSSNGAAAGGADGQVVVSTTATTAAAGHGGGARHQEFSVQAAPAAAFSLDGEEDHSHPPPLHHHQQQQTGSPRHRHKQQHQQQLQVGPHPASNSSDAAPDLDGYVGGGHKGGTARLKGLQQKLHLPGRSVGAGGDVEGQQQLLGPAAINSSSSSHLPLAPASQQQQQPLVSIPMPASDDHHQQQQPGGLKTRLVEPGQESNVVVSLWAMLCDVRAVARGPERAAFAIACCLAVFDQATASTAIINYAPEVLANRMGVEDPNLAIMYPAAIALAKVVGTLIAAVTVDKYGRRPLLFWGGVGCAVFLGLAGVALATSSVALFLAALCLFIFSFSMSWAGLYWVVVSEIFSMGAKSPATSAATSLLFLTGAAVNFVYLSLIGWIGGLAFALFGVVAAGSAWYVWARVPETKGRTLAEIQALLSPAAAVVGGSPVVSPRGRGAGVHDGSGSPMLPVVAQANGGSRLVELRQLMPSREPVQQ